MIRTCVCVLTLVAMGLFATSQVFAQEFVLDAANPPVDEVSPVAPDTPEAPPEPDYAVVAEDARKIADEIEQRLIETDMDEAKNHLFATEAPAGHEKAHEAYVDMKEMISFCEATAGKAGAACNFKLGISMSLNPGQTLGQLSQSFGTGFSGFAGQGSSGQASSTPFGLYGAPPFGQPSTSSTSRLGDQKVKAQSAPNDGSDPLSGNVEELANQKTNDLDFNAESEGPILEEYRPLIEAYFKRLAEEGK